MDLATATAYNTALARKLQGLKKDAKASSIAQNYKGTGSKAYKRQIFVRFANGAAIDLWLYSDRLEFGGVISHGGLARLFGTKVAYEGNTPEQVYEEVVRLFKACPLTA